MCTEFVTIWYGVSLFCGRVGLAVASGGDIFYSSRRTSWCDRACTWCMRSTAATKLTEELAWPVNRFGEAGPTLSHYIHTQTPPSSLACVSLEKLLVLFLVSRSRKQQNLMREWGIFIILCSLYAHLQRHVKILYPCLYAPYLGPYALLGAQGNNITPSGKPYHYNVAYRSECLNMICS